jgi:hypothetical protein
MFLELMDAIRNSKRTSVIGIGIIAIMAIVFFAPSLDLNSQTAKILDRMILLMIAGGLLISKDG